MLEIKKITLNNLFYFFFAVLLTLISV